LRQLQNDVSGDVAVPLCRDEENGRPSAATERQQKKSYDRPSSNVVAMRLVVSTLAGSEWRDLKVDRPDLPAA
jgi:hypothetical protein